MTFAARACRTTEEVVGAFGGIWHYFGADATLETAERFARILPTERMTAIFEDEAVVGGGGAFPLDLTVPGGRSLPCAGVTIIGVLPTHTRRGALRELMRVQLDEARKRGEPLALLWASEETIYGRYGYGMASLAGEIRLPRTYARLAQPSEPAGRVRLVAHEEALEELPEVYERVRRATPGMFGRSRDWWELRRLADTPEHRPRGAGVLVRALLEVDGTAAGYALYRVHQSWEDGVTSGFVNVVEALGDSPVATREIWRYLLGIDWVASVNATLLPLDHALFHLLATPRRMKFRVGDALWLRLVDAEAALAGRSYREGEPVVLELRDEFCPWNEGRWRVGDGRAARTDDEPDLRLDAQALASVYLGGFTFAQLARALRVEEARPDGVDRADALFRTSVQPWCPEIF